MDNFRLPASVEGQTAIVFFASTGAGAGAGPVVLRFFKRPQPSRAQRYHALETYLRAQPVEVFAKFAWSDEGVRVRDTWWPMVRMEHVPGVSLGEFAATNLGQPAELGGLADRWREAARLLTAVGVAHADLQRDNVRVAGTELRLIDLDAAWVPGAARLHPGENGHRHFQHPERIRTGHWDRHVDAFSALVIYLSLKALAADAGLWAHHNEENLILSDHDFVNAGATPIWTRLAASPDLEVRNLSTLLERFCRQSVKVSTDLDTLLRTRTLPVAAVWLAPEAGRLESSPWWAGTVGSETAAAAAQTADPFRAGQVASPSQAASSNQAAAPSQADAGVQAGSWWLGSTATTAAPGDPPRPPQPHQPPQPSPRPASPPSPGPQRAGGQPPSNNWQAAMVLAVLIAVVLLVIILVGR
ncbi:MAG TPA: hypothetical protein VLJ59_14590 [Mycobacteriales bacterium]|nr:hypothetical protein [Mycobacteriales bacterium]